MFRKLPILTALLLAGALLSPILAELFTGKPVAIMVAEECAGSFFDGNDSQYPGLDGGDIPLAGTVANPSSLEQLYTLFFLNQASPLGLRALQQPLFLLFHAFLFYDRL